MAWWWQWLSWFGPTKATRQIKIGYIQYHSEVQCVVTVSPDLTADYIDVSVTPDHKLNVLLHSADHSGHSEIILADQELPSIWQYGYRYLPGHSYDSRLVLNNSVIFTFNQVK